MDRKEALNRALQEIEDCFSPENREMSGKAFAFYRSVKMLTERFDRFTPRLDIVQSDVASSIVEYNRISNGLATGSLSAGHQRAYEGVKKTYSNAFNMIASSTFIELRDYAGVEQTRATHVASRILTAHLRDPSLLPKRRQRSLFVRL